MLAATALAAVVLWWTAAAAAQHPAASYVLTPTDGAELATASGQAVPATAGGPTAVSFAENGWGRVASYTTSLGSGGETVTWVLGGADAAHFSIDSPPGALRFRIDPVAPAKFAMPPDFESPADTGADNVYDITVQPTTSSNTSVPAVSVKVTVTDEDEPGTVTLSTKRPRTAAQITATLSDPDTVTAGSASWQWERTNGKNNWVVIAGASTASYTPGAVDAGSFLRASVTYTDGHGSGAQAQAITAEAVAAGRLASLAVSTDDSTAATSNDDAWRRMRPAFDAATLHYSVGCNASDTMTLVIGPADAASRISVNGIQVANPGVGSTVTATQAVGGDRVVRVALTGSDGARTRYAVHCLADDITKLTTATPLGSAKVLDELILYTDSHRNGQRLMIVDANGVPRWVGRPGRAARPYFRFYPDGGSGEFRYSYTGEVAAVLDENLEVLSYAQPTLPLTQRDSHDFRVLDDGSFMLMAYQHAERDLSALTFTDADLHTGGATAPFGTDVYVQDSAIQIVRPDGRATVTWSSYDHMALEDCTQHRFPHAHGDYAHLNSTQMADAAHLNGAGLTGKHIVASMRGCSRVLGIDAATGKVLWRVGPSNLSDAQWAARDIGPAPLDIIGDPEQQFCGQHAAALLPNGNLILYDNGVQCTRNPWTGAALLRTSDEYSRGVEYALDLANGEAVFVRDHSLGGTETELGYRGGSIEVLSNGHWLISWGGIPPGSSDDPPSDVITQVDPATGQEWLKMDAPFDRMRGTVMPAHALVGDRPALTGRFVAGSQTSVFHSGVEDSPTVLVAFNRPVRDFTAASPSLSVQGASVASVAPHVTAGAPADAYLVTLTPDGSGPITLRLQTGQACGMDGTGGICTADGTVLSKAPEAAVISPPITVSFGAAAYRVTEGSTLAVPVVLSRAHGGPTGFDLPVTATAAVATGDDFSVGTGVSIPAGVTTAALRFVAGKDSVADDAETVTLALGTLPTGFVAGSPASTTVTIGDGSTDAVSFTVTASDAAATEGDSATVTVQTGGVTFAQAQDLALTVTGSATRGTAFTSGVDVVLLDATGAPLATTDSLQLAAGATSTSLTVATAYDATTESEETVTLAFSHDGVDIGSATITLADLNRPPAIASGPDRFRVAENNATSVTTLSASDHEDDTITWTLEGDDAALFTVAGGTLRWKAAPDFEVPGDRGGNNVYDITAVASDGVGAGRRDVKVTVTDVDEPAAVTSASGSFVFGHNEHSTAQVASFSATDPEGAKVRWSVAGADGEHFEISSGGLLRFVRPPDYEYPADSGGNNQYDVQVSARAGASDPVTQTVTVSVVDVDEDGVVALNSPQPQVGTPLVATASDPDGSVTVQSWAWQRSADGADWRDIAGATAASYTPAAGDVSHRLRVTAAYTHGGSAKSVAGQPPRPVRTAPVSNSAPAFPTGPHTRSVTENAGPGTAVGAPVAATDPDSGDAGRLSYSLSGTDASSFSVDQASGQLRVGPRTVFDFETGTTSFSVTVTATDPSGVSATAAVIVTVADANDAPVAADDAAATAEDRPVTITVLTNDSDPDGDTLRVTARDAPQNGSVRVLADNTIEYTPRSDFNGTDVFGYAASDGTASDEALVFVSVSPVNDQPAFPSVSVSRSVADGAPPGTPVGSAVKAADVDGDLLVYTLVGVDTPDFAIDRFTGEITVGEHTVIDRAAKSSYRLRVQATDYPTGARASTYLTVVVAGLGGSSAPGNDTGGNLGGGGGAGGGDDAEPSDAVLIVANGWSPADIGVAAALSARTADSAVIYTAADQLSAPARDVLRDLVPKEVIVIGGEAAVAESVLAAARRSSGTESAARISGASRADTAAAVADRIFSATRGSPTLILANGRSPADIGVAAALSARTPRSAVVYTQTESLPEATRRLLASHRPTRVVIVGGTAAVSPGVENAVRSASPGAAIERVSGPDRIATAAEVARRSLGPPEASPADERTVIVANGWSPPDIGVAAALSARTPGSAVLYTAADHLSASTTEVLRAYQPTRIILVGGTAAISNLAARHAREIAPNASTPRYAGTTRTHTAAQAARLLHR